MGATREATKAPNAELGSFGVRKKKTPATVMAGVALGRRWLGKLEAMGKRIARVHEDCIVADYTRPPRNTWHDAALVADRCRTLNFTVEHRANYALVNEDVADVRPALRHKLRHTR